jgi:hypothetical protein
MVPFTGGIAGKVQESVGSIEVREAGSGREDSHQHGFGGQGHLRQAKVAKALIGTEPQFPPLEELAGNGHIHIAPGFPVVIQIGGGS